MKKLIFIDNDNADLAEKKVREHIIPFLGAYGKVINVQLKDIKIIADLYKMDRAELYNIFFSGENVIITWSVYCNAPEYNSKQQLLHFLRVAAQAKAVGIVYIDMSGELEQCLSSEIPSYDIKHLYDILSAIQMNNIITVIDGQFKLIKIDLGYTGVLIMEDINLKELLSEKPGQKQTLRPQKTVKP